MMRLVLSFLLLAFGLTPLAAQEEPPGSSIGQRVIVQRIATDFVAPRYAVLREKAQLQNDAWTGFCKAPSTAGIADLNTAFADAVLAWEDVALVRYGPISENFRYERMLYWPERRNEVARALTKLLGDEEQPTLATITQKSVATQGFSALERLLYDENAAGALTAGDDDARRRCAAGQAIAANLHTIADEVVVGWSAFTVGLANADETTTREAASRFATDLLTVYQIVGDQKLDGPMGHNAETVRPKAAEFWRSGLSNQAMAANLGSAAGLIALVLGEGHEATKTVRGAADLARGLSGPLPDLLAQDRGRAEVLLLRNAVRRARDLTSETVPVALGVSVGFNSLDGD